MLMFTSDGASVMLGKLNGVAAQLKRDIPHLVQQPCVAHREDLGISEAWKEVKLIRDIDTLMRTVYTVFCRSSRRKCKFQERVDTSECESVAFRPLSEVHWLSRHFALGAIIRNYHPLLEYFEQDKDTDPVSKYCHKKLNTMEYRITLEVLNDVLLELASLSTLLQKWDLTSLEAFHLARGKLKKIRRQYLGDSVLWSDKVKALLDMSSQENSEIDTSSIITFINILCAHLADRFPEDEVQEWSAFDCEAIVKRDFNFGIHQVKSPCSKYKDFIAEEIVIVSQYNDFKFALTERIKSQLVLSFPDMVTFAHQNEQFQELAKLMDIGGTFLASSADCEHGFSLMNTLKHKLRSRLQVDHLDMLVCIKSYHLDGGLIDLDSLY
ncbi:E3 SUMO-protein ligase KIAA1586-like [Caretta caretta]|uniref:E3 SUMO-protein ligase KIAA1586-like n=1 Tax=Caretta caretta TaxID=8467 RepID=UPI002094996A|nr:E3 SUMO-protein ligase KIAA1586-like [Caretta caretta]